MAGSFAGIISPFQQFVDEKRLLEMGQALFPISESYTSIWTDPKKSVGFIQKSEDASVCHYLHYTIVWKGAIYNTQAIYQELKQQEKSVDPIHTAAIMVAAYDCWKEKFLEKLDGKFALAIFDKKTEEIFLARDRFGEQPLYYYGDFRERGRFVQLLFANNMTALWNVGAPKQLDGSMALNYLTLGLAQNPLKKMATFFSDILSLPPGHYLKIKPQAGRVQMRCWYRLQWKKDIQNHEEEAIAQLKSTFQLSEQSTSQNAGYFAQGNISSIALLNSRKETSVSQIFYQQNFSHELKQYIQTQNFRSVTIPALSGNELDNTLTALSAIQEEPLADLHLLSTFRYFQSAAAYNTSYLFCNTGGEDLFGISEPYIQSFLQSIVRHNYTDFRKEKALFQQHGYLSEWKIRNYIAGFAPEKMAEQRQKQLQKAQAHFPHLEEEFLLRYQNPDALRQPEVNTPEDLMYYHFTKSGLEEQLRQLQLWADRLGLQIELPFLRYQLVELLFSLPSHLKFRDGFPAWILRKNLEDNVPSDLVWANKLHAENNLPSILNENKTWQEKVHIAKRKLVAHKIMQPTLLKEKTGSASRDWRIFNLAQLLPS